MKEKLNISTNCDDIIQKINNINMKENKLYCSRIENLDLTNKSLKCININTSEIFSIDNNKCNYCQKCGSFKNVCFNKQMSLYLCGKHRNQILKYGKLLDRTKMDESDIVIHNNYVEIKIYNIKNEYVCSTMVSLDKYDLVKEYKYYIRKDGYIEGNKSKNKIKERFLLHRLIMGFPSNQVDHINRNKLDNRNENLREVTNSQNQVNQGIMKNNTSGITGVTWDKSRNKWKVSLNINNKCYNLGRFDTLEEAKKIRFQAEKEYQKEYIPIERR